MMAGSPRNTRRGHPVRKYVQKNAAYFVVDQANPGLTNLFITEFQRPDGCA